MGTSFNQFPPFLQAVLHQPWRKKLVQPGPAFASHSSSVGLRLSLKGSAFQSDLLILFFLGKLGGLVWERLQPAFLPSPVWVPRTWLAEGGPRHNHQRRRQISSFKRTAGIWPGFVQPGFIQLDAGELVVKAPFPMGLFIRCPPSGWASIKRGPGLNGCRRRLQRCSGHRPPAWRPGPASSAAAPLHGILGQRHLLHHL